MENDAIANKVRAIINETIGLSLLPGDNPQRSQVDHWDSLKHIELILHLEEQFNMRFSGQQVAEIASVDDVVRLVQVYVEAADHES